MWDCLAVKGRHEFWRFLFHKHSFCIVVDIYEKFVIVMTEIQKGRSKPSSKLFLLTAAIITSAIVVTESIVSTSAAEDEKKNDPETTVVTAASISAKRITTASATEDEKKNDP